MRGLLVEVIEDSRGSQATAVALVNASQIQVEDLTSFPESGGIVDVLGVQYAYAGVVPAAESIDPDTGFPNTAGAIVLSGLVTVQVDVDDPVQLVLGGAPATDAYAVVEFPAPTDTDQPDDIASVHVPIDYSQRPMFAAGPYDPAVPIEVSDDLTRVITVPGVKPTIDGSVIVNLPDVVDTDPPASSPTPELTGGVRSIIGRHASVALARSYDIYLSNTNASAPDAAHLVANTNGIIWTIGKVPDVMAIVQPDSSLDKRLQPGVTYYVALVAKNDVGSAAPSAWVPVALHQVTSEDVSAEFVYAGTVAADQIIAGNLAAAVTLTGILKTRNTEMDPGGEFDTAGIRGYAPPEVVGEPAPLQVEIPFDGRPAYFAGDIAARKFDAYEGADLHGDANNIKSDGGMTLETGSSAGSSAAPTVAQGIPSVTLNRPTASVPWGGTVQFDAAACQSFNWDVGAGQFIASQNVSGKGVVDWRITTGGTVSLWQADDGWGHYGYLRDPASGTFYFLTAQVGNPANLWLSGFKAGNPSSLQIPRLNTAETPVGTWASTGQLRVAERVGSTIVTRSYSVAGANPVLSSTTTSDSFWSSSQKIGSLNVTQGPGFAAAQTVFCPRGSGWRIRVASGGTTELPDYEWDATAPIVAICPNGPDTASSGGSWYGLGSDNRLYTYTNSTWTGSFTKRVVVGTTSATSTAETQVGSKVAVDWKRRHQMTVTAPPLITPAIRVGVYAVAFPSGTPTDSAMLRHGYTATGGRTLTISTVLASGSAPGTAPTAGAYPIAAPAWIRSEATDSNGALIDTEGNGTWRLHPLGQTAMLVRTTAQSIGTPSTFTVITGLTSDSGFPSYTLFATLSGGTLTITRAGHYLINGQIIYASNAGGERRLAAIFINGTEARRGTDRAGAVPTPTVVRTFRLSVGDTVDLRAWQDTAGALNANTAELQLTYQGPWV
ncbi:MAG TPA: hypothetical protein VIP77_20210 [Jiangellaceae bacterium]